MAIEKPLRILFTETTDPVDSDFNAPAIEMVAALPYSDVDIRNYRQLPPPPEIEDSYDVIFIPGVPDCYSNTTIGERATAFSMVKDSRLAVFGVCIGHEVIGSIFGANIVNQAVAEHGTFPIQIDPEQTGNALFQGLSDGFDGYMTHYAALGSLPAGFRRFGSTRDCELAMVGNEEGTIVTTQFHPELSGQDGAQLFSNFATVVRARQTQAS